VSYDLTPRFLAEMPDGAWAKILEALGTGDFHAIAFRPPREEESHLGPVNGINRGTWWVCEADYMVITEHDEGAVLKAHEQKRIFPFLLFPVPDDDVV
jgi:hypothetical protein